MAFTHLHVHTEYSLLDGAARIKNLVSRAKELGMTSLAITDHGVMFGIVDFWRECEKNGINGIIGCEVYTAKRSMYDKEGDLDKNSGHLILLAKNNEGYKNLTKIVSRSFIDGFYYKPRVDINLLRKYSKGIVCLSACLAGDIPRLILENKYNEAKLKAEEFIDIFGKENFFLEIQDHGLKEQYDMLPDIKRLSKELDIPLVATNDVHYINKEDSSVHDVLLCIQTGKRIDDENRMKFPNDEFYLKSEEEMLQVFSHTPDAVYNTQKIANMCRVELEFGQLHLPDFDTPKGEDKFEYLKKLCHKGLDIRYSSKEISNQILDRLNYELETIKSMGYVEYFLIVWDFINYAKMNEIFVGPGRGSAAGSIVAYTLGITDIDPIKYNLIFERFLNPERVSMPDIDIDFCYERRQEVIDYVIDKYGQERVSQIITFGTMKAKAAVRDVARVLNVSYSKADSIANAIPFNLKMTIDKALEINPELLSMYQSDDEVKRVIDTAKAIEGMPRHVSTHAAGVVISKENIDEYVPLYYSDKGVATQFPMTTIEELGLLKMDFLGLRNLTVIRDALEIIEENHNLKIDFSNMDYDDGNVYEMISKGNTQGIFQLESSGMIQFMKNLKPDCFEDIVAGISLYRPGPMASIPMYISNKKNPNSIEYLHPSLEPILSVTYGCLVYQEQVMQIVRDLAGYTYGRSDILRRAMGKKKMDVMLAEKEEFIKGCQKNNIENKIAGEIFNQMVTFAEYAFNKSHAAAYAVIGYQTGFLKANYTVEFMAALLTSVMHDNKQISKYIRNCKEMSIEVLPPDINKSYKKFTVENGKIRFGMLGIKSLGEAAIDYLVQERNENGKYENIFDFIRRQEKSKINKKGISSLIMSGSFDSIHDNRASLLSAYEGIIDSVQKSSKNILSGQISLFDLDSQEKKLENISLPDIKPYTTEENLALEKEILGVYVTGHPLEKYIDKIENISTINSEEILKIKEDRLEGIGSKYKNRDKVIVSGIIINSKKLLTKKKDMMAFVDLEDIYGVCKIVIFPKTFEKYQNYIKEDEKLVIEGNLDISNEESTQIIAQNIYTIDEYEDNNTNKNGLRDIADTDKEIHLDISEGSINDFYLEFEDLDKYKNIFERKNKSVQNQNGVLKINLAHYDNETIAISELLPLLKKYEGNNPVYIYFKNRATKVNKNLYISYSPNLINELVDKFGKENIKFEKVNKK